VPGADTTWEEFLDDCEKIKNAGYTPIAAALGNIPHYWWG
jgi:raffinose/stachyose/melibiose transport system substrate-binding protein